MLEKQNQNIRAKNSGPKFGRPKFVSQNSALNSGSGGTKSFVQTFVPDKIDVTVPEIDLAEAQVVRNYGTETLFKFLVRIKAPEDKSKITSIN